MGNIIVVLLVVALVKFVVIAWILYVVFKPDIKSLWSKKPSSQVPTCLYCQSKWTHPIDEGQTRWENEELVLVTTYECEHCHLPFWHVERVPIGTAKR
jgi:hypothetical protein